MLFQGCPRESSEVSTEHGPFLANNLNVSNLSWKVGDFKNMDVGQSPHNQTQRMGPDTIWTRCCFGVFTVCEYTINQIITK